MFVHVLSTLLTLSVWAVWSYQEGYIANRHATILPYYSVTFPARQSPILFSEKGNNNRNVFCVLPHYEFLSNIWQSKITC